MPRQARCEWHLKSHRRLAAMADAWRVGFSVRRPAVALVALLTVAAAAWRDGFSVWRPAVALVALPAAVAAAWRVGFSVWLIAAALVTLPVEILIVEDAAFIRGPTHITQTDV